jgi:hypothetical protein
MALYQKGRIKLDVCLLLGSLDRGKSSIKLYLDQHRPWCIGSLDTSFGLGLISAKSAVDMRWLRRRRAS